MQGLNFFMEVFQMMFPSRLKSLRVQTGVTQKAIAEGIGVAPVSLQRFEYGTVKPKLDTVTRLADFFDVSTSIVTLPFFAV